MSAQPEAEKIEGYEGTDLIVIFGVLVMAIGVAIYKMVERMYQAWQRQRGDRDDPDHDGSGAESGFNDGDEGQRKGQRSDGHFAQEKARRRFHTTTSDQPTSIEPRSTCPASRTTFG